MTVKDFDIPNINAEIRADTCGTAFQKTILVTVNCEMTINEARKLSTKISEAMEWLSNHERDCKKCPDRSICEGVPA